MAKTKPRRYRKPKKGLSVEPVLEVVVPATPPWKFDRLVAVEVIGLLLMPLVAFWVMRFVPINQNHFIDPYVYTGYIHDFRDLIARYGVTYYSVRFGLIVPAEWFAQLFGPVSGYFTLRYVLALTAGIPLYYVVKAHFSQPVAVLTVAGMLTSPYFALALLWEHPDATGVPFLTAAVCLFLLDERSSPWRDTLAGAFAAMAIHSNFFVISLVGIFGVLWFACSLLSRRPLKDLIKHFAGVTVGALLVTALGYLYYWHTIGTRTDIFSVTLGMAIGQARGGAKQWRTPNVSWIATQVHVLVPVFLVVCCMLVTRWRRVALTGLVVVSFGAAATGFYYAEQFLLDSNILQFFYYVSYLIPAVFLMLAFLWQTLWERIRRRAPAFVGLGLAALLGQWLLAIWGGWTLPNLALSHRLALDGGVAVMVFLATQDWRVPAMKNILPWLALAVLSSCFTLGFTDYSGVVLAGPADRNREMDVYRVSMQFLRAVPTLAEHPGIIRFWYNNRAGNSISSVQSTELWGYSKLNGSPPEDPGLPYLNESELHVLRDPQVIYLALLCESEQELSQGLAALTREAVAFKTVDSRVLASGEYRVYFRLVELRHSPDVVSR